MEKIQQQHHVEDVGKLLLQTQEHLRVMREYLAAAEEAKASSTRHTAIGATTEVQTINVILRQTEMELKAKAELLLNGMMMNSASSAQSEQSQTDKRLPTGRFPLTVHRSVYSGPWKRKLSSHTHTGSIPLEFFREQFRNSSVEVRESSIPSPQHRHRCQGQLVHKKTAQCCRLLPSVNKSDPSAPPPELYKDDAKHGVLNLVTRGFLPAHADLTAAFAGPSGSRDKLIGGALYHSATRMYNRSEQSVRSTPMTMSTGCNYPTLKFDLRSPSTPQPHKPDTTRRRSLSYSPKILGPSKVTMSFPGSAKADKRSTSSRQSSSVSDAITSLTNRESNREHFSKNYDRDFFKSDWGKARNDSDPDETEMERLGVNIDRTRGEEDLLDFRTLNQLLIRKGHTMRNTPEFVSFRKVAQEHWGTVEEILQAFETLLSQYFVPLANVDCQRLLSLAATGQPRFSKCELLSCVLNKDQVISIIRRPGQRYKGNDCKRLAATTIQASIRMWLECRRYTWSRASDVSATKIQLAWRSHCHCVAFAARLKSFRREQREKWEARMHNLKTQWSQIAGRGRVVVHVPSLSIDERSRLSAENFAVKQNLQLARICSAALDSHVDLLVYVSPFELTADVSQYFMNLLQLGGLADIRTRVKLVFPEQATRFPAHFSLSSLLLYSPRCLRRIRHYTADKEAYLVMGLPGAEDEQLAITLDLPILGARPSLTLPLVTRSGGKRLFIRADVNVPIGTYALYNEHEVIEALAELAVAHMEQSRWLLKLDYDPFGVGEAVVDLSNMQSLREIRRKKRTPEHSHQTEPRMAAVRLVLDELRRPNVLSRLAMPIHSEVFPTWRKYTEAIGHYGCVVEAVPPRTTVALPGATQVPAESAYIRANLFVDPNGAIHITSTQNVLTSDGGDRCRKTVAFTFPQTAAPYEAMKGACNAVGKLLIETNVWGYVSLDFVVSTGEMNAGAPRLWALAIHPYLTDSAASFACFQLVTRGVLDASSGVYRVADTSSLTLANLKRTSSCGVTDLLLHEASLAKRFRAGAPRCFVVCSYVFHPQVTTMQYTSFFHVFNLHGVFFDQEYKVGTLFLLTDSLTTGVFGILSIGETTEDALAFQCTALEVIGREVGEMALSPSRALSSRGGNFKQVLFAIRAYTGVSKGKGLGEKR